MFIENISISYFFIFLIIFLFFYSGYWYVKYRIAKKMIEKLNMGIMESIISERELVFSLLAKINILEDELRKSKMDNR
jgi:hypothetical protein